MASYDFVNPPGGVSYAPPAVDFSWLGQLPGIYRQAQDEQRQLDVANAFKNQPLPLDASGAPDYGKIMQILASKGGIDAVTRLAPAATDQAMLRQAGQISPLLGGSTLPPQQGGAPLSPQAAPPPIQQQSIPAPPAAASAGYTPMRNAGNSVANIVQSALPPDRAGPVIANMARSLGVQPEDALTPEQEQALTRRLGAYVSRTGGTQVAQAAPAPAAGAGGTAVATPSQMADARSRLAAAMSGQPPQSTNAAAADVPRSAMAGGAAPPSQAAPPPPAPAATAGPPQAPQAGGGPLVPTEPLSPGFTDWRQNVAALEQAASARARFNPTEAKLLMAKAERIRASHEPVKVGQYDTLVDPQTGQTVYQGPMARILGGGAGAGTNAATLDADAERYRQTGTLPPNMGRGVQGQAEAAAIRTRAAEHEIAAGGDPATWPDRWQEYRARGVGLSAGERVAATREKNLDLILKVTESAIPAALEQSAKVWRSGFVPLNRIIQRGEIMTSDPELRSFGMANLQLAEGWARAMNPTGVMRESDREKALEFLSTADSPETYRRLVTQLQTQITRERDSIRRGEAPRQGDQAPAPGIGGMAAVKPGAAERFNELIRGGMSKQDAYARMHAEGY